MVVGIPLLGESEGHVAFGPLPHSDLSGEADVIGSPFVGHGFQLKDIFDELVAGVGTYVLTEGPTARVFEEGYRLPIAGCTVYEDGNITIDGSDDATGGVFAKEAIVLVQGRAPRIVDVRNEKRGGGGFHVYHYDEYAYGERSSGNWLYSMVSDATAPTS